MKMKKNLWWIPIGIAVAAAVAIGVGWWQAARVSEVGTARIVAWPATASTGEIVEAVLELTVPWGVTPESVAVQPPPGWLEYGRPAIVRSSLGWARSDYRIVTRLRPYQAGDGAETTLTVHFERTFGAPPTPLPVTLAAVKSVAAPGVQPGEALPLAGRLTPEAPATRGWLVWLVIGLGALTAAVAYWWLRHPKRGNQAVPEPWEVAENEVRALRNLVKQNRDLTGCLIRLTDVVREYLEKRFETASTRQTTAEFLREMNRPQSPLPNAHRKKLADFMTAADLVKFAGQEANAMLLNPALDEAETLIQETRPRPESEAREEEKHV